MAERPLRQFYDHDVVMAAPPEPADLVGPWTRHRRRFVEALGGMGDDQWRSTTRCDDWNAIDVAWHLITADQFWELSITSGTSGVPTTFLRDFDPSSTPGAIAAAARLDSPTETLDAMGQRNESFIAAVESVDAEGWHRTAESPFGHVPAHLALAHAFWDSWLHERDILLPLGLAPEPEMDELWCVTCYSLFAAALQGGLPFDSEPVAEGPGGELAERVGFEEFPARTLEVSVGHGVSLTEVDASSVEVAGGTQVGGALALVEGFTGRSGHDGFSLPADLAAQIERARLIL